MKLSITHNFAEVAQALSTMRKDVAQAATARALNRTIEQARTAMSREIRSEFNLPAAKVREALRIKRARLTGGVLALSAALEAPATKGRSLNVIAFAARQTRQGVTVRIRKDGGRKLIRGAWIGNNGRTVFVREPGTTMRSRAKYAGTKHAERITGVRTINVPQMFNTQRINARVLAHIRTVFPTIFAREAAFAISRAASGARP